MLYAQSFQSLSLPYVAGGRGQFCLAKRLVCCQYQRPTLRWAATAAKGEGVATAFGAGTVAQGEAGAEEVAD